MTINTVAQLMTADPLCVTRDASLKDAHDLMREKNIRHIPVIDSNGELVGMLTQKIMVAKVMGLMAQFGKGQQFFGELAGQFLQESKQLLQKAADSRS